MEMTSHALLTAVHGMLFGAFFLLAFFGVIVELCRQLGETQPAELTPRAHLLERLYLLLTVALGWAAVLTGTYLVYPWYRALPPAGVVNLAAYPQALLKSSPATIAWHSFGMEWKEHVAWLAPIAMTMVAWVLLRYPRHSRQIRAAVLAFALVAFTAAGVAGFFGAMLNKRAPIDGGPTIRLMEGAR